MADDWGFDLVQPVYVAELIPSKDFLETEAEMFPAPKLEPRAVNNTTNASTFMQSLLNMGCCCFPHNDLENGEVETVIVKEEDSPLVVQEEEEVPQDEDQPRSGFYQTEYDMASGCYRSWIEFENIKDDVTYVVKITTVVNSRIIKSKFFEVDDVGWLG